MYKKIIDFQVGEDIQGYYLVKQSQLRVTNAGKKYLDATLIDNSAEVNAKYWDAEDLTIEVIKEGKIVKISARVNEWHNQKQLSIKKYRPIGANDEVNIENFVPSAPISGELLYERVMAKIDEMQDDDIKRLCQAFYIEKKDDILIFPAAKSNHHAIRSGLIYHVFRMLELADKMCGVYPHVNRDLLRAGVLLHDLCKIDEMAVNAMGLVSEYTTKGNLLGHITMGINLIAERAAALHIDEEVTMLIQHMILTHHYYPEFGSPKKPLFIEAELLHHIDVIDAAVYDFEKATRDIEAGSFSAPVWSLDRRRVYKHSR